MHLTDNQAWRLSMDKYPDLVKEGTYYYDFPELSGKYYSKEDLKEIVTYAGTRGIEIIPEVDLPGHSIALLAALPVAQRICMRFISFVSMAHRHKQLTHWVMMPRC